MSVKRHYVLVERVGDGPNINGFDSWLCPWEDLVSFLTAPLEEIDEGVKFTISLTILSMTDDELEAYCQEQELEWGEE